MSDAVAKKTIPFGRPIIGEEEKRAVAEILDGPILVHGPKAHEFEDAFAAFTGSPYATSLASCTAGLHLAYFYKGLGPGDEVIVPAQTHTATAHAVEYVGAKPVFVDAERETGNIDIDQIEDAITDNTRAMSLVHFLGMPVDMDRINALAAKYELFVVEDCALAIGTYYKGVHAGLLGDLGAYSFYPVKHMTTAEGGMLISKHEEVVARIERQKAFGVDRHVGERKIPGQYDVDMLGFNYRMNEIEAALGIEQLKRMPEFLTKRRENYEALEAGLKQIDEIELLQSTHGDFQSSYYCLSVILKEPLAAKRVDLINSLKEKGIGTSIYYPKPVPHLSYYAQKYGYTVEQFPNAARISYRSIALPVGPHLDTGDMEYIVEEFKNTITEVQ
ncbi:MAG: DegT/DnrJ/EryC1/StrS family aminotransferase [Candidatus Omnitrophica bacterium]|nr:DegT/DnrJ/EryC1/StrS family aminotransferase [Candidatus Omnitrophota bacterium]